MNSIWYKFRSQPTWGELQIPSIFITIGEMRALICKELHLPSQETVILCEDENFERLADEKQFPRGSKFHAMRTTLDHLDRQAQEKARKLADAKEAERTKKEEVTAAVESDDEFGPDIFNREAQKKYHEKERLKELDARTAETSWQASRGATSVSEKRSKAPLPTKLPTRPSTKLVEMQDELEIDWGKLIEQRRAQNMGIKLEPPGEFPPTSAEVKDDQEQRVVSKADTEAEHGCVIETGKRDKSFSPEAPPVPSLLETCPWLYNNCQAFLPEARLKDLYAAFPQDRPRSRSAWEAFRRGIKRRRTEEAEHDGRKSPPVQPAGQ